MYLSWNCQKIFFHLWHIRSTRPCLIPGAPISLSLIFNGIGTYSIVISVSQQFSRIGQSIRFISDKVIPHKIGQWKILTCNTFQDWSSNNILFSMAVSLQILSSSLDTYKKIKICASNFFHMKRVANCLKKMSSEMKSKMFLKDEQVNYPVMKGIKCIV